MVDFKYFIPCSIQIVRESFLLFTNLLKRKVYWINYLFTWLWYKFGEKVHLHLPIVTSCSINQYALNSNTEICCTMQKLKITWKFYNFSNGESANIPTLQVGYNNLRLHFPPSSVDQMSSLQICFLNLDSIVSKYQKDHNYCIK